MKPDLDSLAGDFAEYGTKASGFADGGPFSCTNCVHMKHTNKSDVCTHPKVNDDPELKDRDRVSSFVVVDSRDCCRYVRPESK